MPTNGDSLAEKVQSSYRKLSAVASELNFVSDELGTCVSEMDSALKKLNLGIEVWVAIRHDGPDDGGMFYNEDLGYAKISGKWGIAIRTRCGNDYADECKTESWLFNDAPRSLRLSSIGKIPDLLEQLSVDASVMVNEISGRLTQVEEVASVVKKAAEEPTRKIIARGRPAPEVKK